MPAVGRVRPRPASARRHPDPHHRGGCLGGIGFTMALFIAGLALDGTLLPTAKIGIFAGSVLSRRGHGLAGRRRPFHGSGTFNGVTKKTELPADAFNSSTARVECARHHRRRIEIPWKS